MGRRRKIGGVKRSSTVWGWEPAAAAEGFAISDLIVLGGGVNFSPNSRGKAINYMHMPYCWLFGWYMHWDGLEFLSSLTTKCLLTQPQQMIYSQLQATGRSDQSLLMCSIAGISLLKELSKFLAPRTRWLMRLLSAPFGIIQIPAVCSDVNQTCCLLRFVYAGLLFVISVIPLGGCWQFTARRVK
jgi:hypothetical protein